MTIPPSLQQQLKPIAKGYGCTLRELVLVAVEELVAAHSAPSPAPKAETKVQPGERLMDARRRLDTETEVVWNGTAVSRHYSEKVCSACSKPFTPTGPNTKACPQCRAEFNADKRAAA